MELKVGILAIGNEVVEGQIQNKNAAWLSQELSHMGAKPLYHISCRDNKVEIPNALDFLSNHCQLIITIGGLGPTKDDFSKECIGEWAQKKMILDEASWLGIKKKLEGLNLTIREGHKNQAYFPEGSEILLNDTGVAPGFFTKTKNNFISALPGPPTELEPMFSRYLKPLIIQKLEPKANLKLYTWICFGAPESEVAHIVESIIGSKYEIGFRLHKPYVEVKIWGPLELLASDQKLFEIMESKLTPWFVANDIPSIRKKFHDYLGRYKKVFVIDHFSNGLFIEKIQEYHQSSHIRYQCFETENFRFFTKDEVLAIHKSMPVTDHELLLSIFPASETQAYISFNNNITLFKTPRNISIKSNIGKNYILENCFLSIKNISGKS